MSNSVLNRASSPTFRGLHTQRCVPQFVPYWPCAHPNRPVPSPCPPSPPVHRPPVPQLRASHPQCCRHNGNDGFTWRRACPRDMSREGKSSRERTLYSPDQYTLLNQVGTQRFLPRPKSLERSRRDQCRVCRATSLHREFAT